MINIHTWFIFNCIHTFQILCRNMCSNVIFTSGQFPCAIYLLFLKSYSILVFLVSSPSSPLDIYFITWAAPEFSSTYCTVQYTLLTLFCSHSQITFIPVPSPSSSSIQTNCSAVRACSLSLCSSGHLASYCLIYLRVSVIYHWESIVFLNLTDFPCRVFDAYLFANLLFFLLISFHKSLLTCLCVLST